MKELPRRAAKREGKAAMVLGCQRLGRGEETNLLFESS